MIVEAYKIESEPEADDYLRSLFERQEYRSIEEVTKRAQQYINDSNLKNYFLSKAKEMLRTYNPEK